MTIMTDVNVDHLDALIKERNRNVTNCQTCANSEDTAVDTAARLVPEINAEYPWDQCIADQLEAGYDEESAKNICGYIKARSQGTAAKMEDLITARKLEQGGAGSGRYPAGSGDNPKSGVEKPVDAKPKDAPATDGAVTFGPENGVSTKSILADAGIEGYSFNGNLSETEPGIPKIADWKLPSPKEAGELFVQPDDSLDGLGIQIDSGDDMISVFTKSGSYDSVYADADKLAKHLTSLGYSVSTNKEPVSALKHIVKVRKLAQGGPGSGRYPAGSGGNGEGKTESPAESSGGARNEIGDAISTKLAAGGKYDVSATAALPTSKGTSLYVEKHPDDNSNIRVRWGNPGLKPDGKPDWSNPNTYTKNVTFTPKEKGGNTSDQIREVGKMLKAAGHTYVTTLAPDGKTWD
jgi:hypothetical protein